MPGTNFDELRDLLNLTRSKYPLVPNLTLLLKYGRYRAINMLLSETRVNIESGKDVRYKIMLKESGSAKAALPFERTRPSTDDYTDEAVVPWRMIQADYSIEDYEVSVNSAPEQLVELFRINRLAALMGKSNFFEERVWKSLDTPTDKKNIYGLPYHFPIILDTQATDTTALNGGFQGANPYAEDGQAIAKWQDLDRSLAANARARSWNECWESTDGFATERDVEALDNMFMDLEVEAPMTIDESLGEAQAWRIFTGRPNVRAMVRMARNKDTGLGPDLGEHAGLVTYRNIPIKDVPMLADDYHRLYVTDFNGIHFNVLDGFYMRETEGLRSRDQHTVETYFIDTRGNIGVSNPRAGGVISVPRSTS